MFYGGIHMKRFITVLLVISMVIGLVPVFAVTAAETKASGITIDGKIDDWAGLHTVGVVGSGEADGKQVTFYGKLTDEGLYLAADVYHGVYTNNTGTDNKGGNWWRNANFEVFINRSRDRGNQFYASAIGKTTDDGWCYTNNGDIQAQMVTQSVTGKGAANYHTVAEMFFPTEKFGFVTTTQEYGTINVGMAWKSNDQNNDQCNNGDANGGGMSDYWVAKGSWPDNNNKLVVTAEGVYTEAQYYPDYFSYIPRKAQWSYLTATQNPDAAGEGWNTTVNPSWALGNAPFGNRADGYLNTWGTTDNPADGTQNNAYLWVAKEFTVEDINALEGVSLFTKMFFDDHIKLYINGKLVFSNDSWNGGYDRYMLAYDASTILKEGKNVIAASLHQHHGGYEFDLELYATNLPQDRNNNLPSYAYIYTVEQYMEYVYICNVLASRSDNNTTGKYIYLETDLDFSGKSWTPLTIWKGVLDGQGHTVSGITAVIDATSGDYGLIVNIASNNNFNGTVKNLTVCDSIIVADKTNGYVGGIMGHSNRGIVENCTIDNVTVIGGNGAGAAVGWTQWASNSDDTATYVSNCTVNDTTVIANNYAAGLVGAYKDADIIVNKHTLSNVIVKANATDNLANPIGSSVVRESAEGSTADVTKTADKTIAITDGAASTFDSTAPENIVITTSASAMAVKSVKVANKEVAFSVVPGDAVSVITIDIYDLSALANGEYDVAIVTYEGDLNAKLTVVGYLDGVALKGFTANLGGEIGLNFHMELSEEILNDPSANVQFTVDWAHDPIPVANGTPSKDIEGAYIFTCRVPVKQINSDISVKVVSDSGESVTYVYSVADYASYIVNAASGYSAETKALASSMLHYGATAQIALNYKPGFLPDYTAPEITAPDLDEYKDSVINDGAADIDYLGGSANLDSAIELNYYFAVKNGTEVTDDTFKAIGKTVTVIDASMPEGVGEEYETGWSCYRVTVQNISAKDYNKYYTVEAAVGGETLTVGYSVYTYVAKAIESTGTENANAAIAAYHYSECAKAYFASKNA